jgi:hypothetical protein
VAPAPAEEEIAAEETQAPVAIHPDSHEAELEGTLATGETWKYHGTMLFFH